VGKSGAKTKQQRGGRECIHLKPPGGVLRALGKKFSRAIKRPLENRRCKRKNLFFSWRLIHRLKITTRGIDAKQDAALGRDARKETQTQDPGKNQLSGCSGAGAGGEGEGNIGPRQRNSWAGGKGRGGKKDGGLNWIHGSIINCRPQSAGGEDGEEDSNWERRVSKKGTIKAREAAKGRDRRRKTEFHGDSNMASEAQGGGSEIQSASELVGEGKDHILFQLPQARQGEKGIRQRSRSDFRSQQSKGETVSGAFIRKPYLPVSLAGHEVEINPGKNESAGDASASTVLAGNPDGRGL